MDRRNEEQKKKHAEEQMRYAKKYPERIKAIYKKYRENHKEELKERKRIYRTGHDSRHNQYRREKQRETYLKCNPYKYHKMWTKEEENFLRENYDTMTVMEIADYLERTFASVERKRARLGIIKGESDECIK